MSNDSALQRHFNYVHGRRIYSFIQVQDQKFKILIPEHYDDTIIDVDNASCHWQLSHNKP